MDRSALEEIRESFQDFSEKLGDHRINRNKRHSVEEILFLTLCALICGCEGWRDIERYGKIKLDFLRSFFPYEQGIPSDDTVRRFFRALDPAHFHPCFSQWAQTLKVPGSCHIAIDGKVSRHTFDGEASPLHMVSAFASECRLVLAQEKVSDKSNEIKAIPALLELLDLKEAIVTLDAMGCQKEVAGLIKDKQADYVFSLKGNQGTLHKDVELVFQDPELLKTLDVDLYKTLDGSEHGRLEERIYRVINIPSSLKEQHSWPSLKTFTG
jgi:predicted transposase YbfD/YdcC